MPGPAHSPFLPHPDMLAYLGSSFKLSEKFSQALKGAIKTIQIPKGASILQPGETCSSVAFLVSGAMRSHTVNDKADEITYFLFFESSFVADFRSLVTHIPSRFCIEAIEPCTMDIMAQDQLDQILEEFPQGHRVVRALVESAYVQLDQRTESLLVESAAERYERFIQHYSAQVNRIPQYVIASWIGVKPESLSRIRRRRTASTQQINPDQ